MCKVNFPPLFPGDGANCIQRNCSVLIFKNNMCTDTSGPDFCSKMMLINVFFSVIMTELVYDPAEKRNGPQSFSDSSETSCEMR